MKILYTSLHDPRFGMGGAEKVLLELALSMRRDYGVEVYAAVNEGDLQRALFKQGIAVTPLFWSKQRTLETVLHLKKATEQFQPDLIHSHHRYTTFLTDLFFKKRTRLLHTEHVLRGDKALLFRYGHHATAVHESVRGQLMERYRVPGERVTTIPNAVLRPVCIPEQAEALRRKYPVSEPHTRILCMGRLEEQKGHRYLIEAVMRLPETYRRRLSIFIAGEGRLDSELRSQIRSFQIESCFHFLGHVQSIADYLELCDFMVLPSLWEGMPLVVLEAQAAGRAVLATDIPGTRETLLNGETGFLVPARSGSALAKALMDWMDHPEQVRAMGQAARVHASKEFSFSVMLNRYYQLYEKMLTQQAR